ncbi:hypothetical protein B0H12DRAFT_618694 [Mycena haematopus]|nr:hypothetical protein B0H12DRAFT_618694 [Mycena haematopus]
MEPQARRGIPNCQTFLTIISSSVPLSYGSTSLIFFLHVRAAYDANLLITAFFAFLWISVVGTAILLSISGLEAEIFNGVCILTKVPWKIAVPVIVLTVHDTSVFVAMSCRLLANSHDYEEFAASRWRMLRALVHGANMHAFSKTLFRDGQNYYLIAVITNVLTIAMIYAPMETPSFHALFAAPNLALTSIMAGRVYRNARLHLVSARHTLPQLELRSLHHLSPEVNVVTASPG